MTKREKSLLTALSLGDGCLKLNGKTSGMLHINHSVKQRMYIEYKKRLLDSIFNRDHKIRQYVSKLNGKEYDYLSIHCCNKYFKYLKKYLSIGGEKRISVKALSRLDSLGLAILYCDDGNLLKRNYGLAVRLHLSLYKHEFAPIINFFKEKWGIEFVAYKEHSIKELYLLYASTREALKFLDIVKPHILNDIKALIYKVDY